MEREELLLSITRCPELAAARNDAGHPCHRVVCFQRPDDYHVPEPWQGHIETAPILFVSLNPGYGANEVFPTPAWDNADTVDFFQRRFDAKAGWTRRDGNRIYLRVKRPDGTSGFDSSPVPFWGNIRDRAQEILGRNPDIGRDYALTMAVHCKSREGSDANPAMTRCTRKWLPSIMAISPAKIVVTLSKPTQNACARLWDLDGTRTVHFDKTIAGRQRAVINLPHPAARVVNKRVSDHVRPDQLRRLRALLADE